ncbi:MAG: glycoside hydrolase [Thaumarchaeota archaeon]|nr:glycoside hydrolase [Nitrososphaerota archaeon]
MILLVILLPTLAASASGASFSTPANLGAGFNPNVQSVGTQVYVAWTDKSSGIMFRASSDGGQTFSSAVKVGAGGQYPIMSATGNNVYIVWSSGGINFVNSSDNGAHWSKPIKVGPVGAITPFITSDSSVISVVYDLSTSASSYVTSSSDSGKTWTTPYQFSDGHEGQVAVSGSNVYVIADSNSKANVQYGVSHDSGKTFAMRSLSAGSEPWIVATGSNVYAVWETKGPQSLVWFMSSPDNGNTVSYKIISGNMPDSWNPMMQAIGSSVWVGIEELGAKTQNWMLTSTDGGSTWKSTSVSGLGHQNGFIFSVATTDGTNVFAMWLELSGSNWVVMVACSPDGGSTWSTVNIGQSDANTDLAIGSMSSNGPHGFAAWQHNSAISFSFS